MCSGTSSCGKRTSPSGKSGNRSRTSPGTRVPYAHAPRAEPDHEGRRPVTSYRAEPDHEGRRPVTSYRAEPDHEGRRPVTSYRAEPDHEGRRPVCIPAKATMRAREG